MDPCRSGTPSRLAERTDMTREAFTRWLWGFLGWLALILTLADVDPWLVTVTMGAGMGVAILIVADLR
jgi:hypothetical protein